MISVSHIKSVLALSVMAFMAVPVFGAEHVLDLKAGQARVTAEHVKGDTWRVAVLIERADVLQDTMLLAAIGSAQSTSDADRYVCIPSDGTRTFKASILVDLPPKTQMADIIVARKVKGASNQEVLRLGVTREGVPSFSLHAFTEMTSAPEERLWIAMRPPLHQWLGQGPCFVSWKDPVTNDVDPIVWKADRVSEKIDAKWTQVTVVPPKIISLAISNRAIELAENGRHSEATALLAHAEHVAEMLDTTLELQAVLWLNHGLMEYSAGDKMRANQLWRRVTVYPKEHVGVAGVLCQLTRRRMETLQAEIGPSLEGLVLQHSRELKDQELWSSLLGTDKHVRSSIRSRDKLSLTPQAVHAVEAGEPMAIDVDGERMFVLSRAIAKDGERVQLSTVKLSDGSLLGSSTIAFPDDVMIAHLADDVIWAVSDKERRVYCLRRTDTSWNISKEEVPKSLGNTRLSGAYADDNACWVLLADKDRGLDGKFDVHLYCFRVEKEQLIVRKTNDLALPKEVAEVQGLCFGSDTVMDVAVATVIDLKQHREAAKEFSAAHGNALTLCMGGAAHLALMQVLEATEGVQKPIYGLYRWQKDIKPTDKMLLDLSGQAFAAKGIGSAVAVRGTAFLNSAMLLEVTADIESAPLYTAIVLDRLLAIKAVIPITPVKGERPLIAFRNDVLIVAFPKQGRFDLIRLNADARWTPAEAKRDYVPTPDRPMIARNGDLIILDKDEKGELKIPTQTKPHVVGVAPNGMYGAMVFADISTGTVIKVYGANGREILSKQIAKEPYAAAAYPLTKGSAVVHLIAPLEDWEKNKISPLPKSLSLPAGVKNIAFVHSDKQIERLESPGQCLRLYAVDDTRWLCHALQKDGLHAISLFNGTKVEWSHTLPSPKDEGTPSVWMLRTKSGETRIGVQASGYYWQYGLDGKKRDPE